MKALKTVILFGGNNSEHQVSLMSSTSVLKNIDRERFEVIMLGITEEGRWLEYTGPVELIASGAWETSGFVRPAFISPDRGSHGMIRMGQDGVAELVPIDVAFPVMHGRFAEDGSMQGLFALAGIPCVGPDTCSSAVCMDKEYSHILLDHAGIPSAKWLALRRDDCPCAAEVERLVADKLGAYPVFVKPACAGSSVGVSKAKDLAGLEKALALAFLNDSKVLIEEAVVGQEVECAVLGNHSPEAASCLGEVVPKAEFYDYNAKYFDTATDLHIPARVSQDTACLIRETALKAYRALGCRGLSRVDFFVRGRGDIVLNELNTLPGFTSTSMYPKLFTASGVPYGELITRLLELAMEQDLPA